MTSWTSAHTQPYALPRELKLSLEHELERVYANVGPFAFNDSHASRYTTCLVMMEACRRAVLEHLGLIHSQLRLRLSAMHRINQLPADVLIHIFASMSFEELLRATHVCHYWRKLALETPALWAHLDLDGPILRDAEFLLARSKATLVNISLSSAYTTTIHADQSIASLEGYMYRLRRLSIRPQTAALLNQDEGRQILVPLPHVIKLQTLSIDWDKHNSGIVIRRPAAVPSSDPPDFSSLQEVALQRGILDASILQCCTHLQKLVLYMPISFLVADVLQVIESNPRLVHLELRFPRLSVPESRPLDDSWDRRLIHPSLHHLVLGEHDGSGRGAVDWTPTDVNVREALFFLHWLDCVPIAHIDINFLLLEMHDDVYRSVLEHLRSIEVLDCYARSLRAEDQCGHTRWFHGAYMDRPLDLAFPVAGQHLRMLRVSAREWDILADEPPLDFPSLEELFLVGDGSEYALMRPSASCPHLRILTMYIMRYARSFRVGARYAGDDESDEVWMAVGVAIALRRICRGPMPQLDVLNIVGQYDTDRMRQVNCSPPLPATLRVSVRWTSGPWEHDPPTTLSWDDFPILRNVQTDT